jgi:hypothetical protein
MKKPSAAEIALHAACWIGIAACYGLAQLAFPTDANAKAVLLTAAGVLYGKLCFKPANPILARVLQALAPAEVERLSQRPAAAQAVVYSSDAVRQEARDQGIAAATAVVDKIARDDATTKH